MRKIEKVVIGLILGAVPVIACMLAGWWGSIPFVPESHVYQFALGGFLLGTFLDTLFLGGWIRRAYLMRTGLWIGIYIFYSIGMLGFFMGFPVFNVVLAIPAGIFVGRQLSLSSAEPRQVHKATRRFAVFTTGILGFVCMISASLALTSPSTVYDIQGMMRLPFPVTRVMIIGIIAIGGMMILALNWWLTIMSVEYSYRYFGADFKS